jgi:hypothetical protein
MTIGVHVARLRTSRCDITRPRPLRRDFLGVAANNAAGAASGTLGRGKCRLATDWSPTSRPNNIDLPTAHRPVGATDSLQFYRPLTDYRPLPNPPNQPCTRLVRRGLVGG